jgi:hypothetical protein
MFYKAAICFLLSLPVMASIHHAPPSLNLNRSEKGVFVDFKKANVQITYDVSNSTAVAKTRIEFSQLNKGLPIFDLVSEPTSITLDGVAVSIGKTSMDGVSTVRFVTTATEVGDHVLEISNKIEKGNSFTSNSVKSGFWMSDLSDRRYLEQYLPTNLEYDQYQMNFDVKILNSNQEHVLYTNGEVNELERNHFKVQYPKTYTASSLFFHLAKKGDFNESRTVFKSIDGREIPMTVYSRSSVSRYQTKAMQVIRELEADYGPWPHNSVVIYGAGSGGMEYCGATITSFSALGHELTHSYFARGIMPAHGNAGWVDEAIASWRDGGYRSYTTMSLSRTRMAAHSVYQRTTDRGAYTKGMKFIGFLHNKFKGTESFKVFLKSFFAERAFKPFKTKEFKKSIEDFYNTTLTTEFDKYIYGKNGVDKSSNEAKSINPFHPQLSEKDLLNLL